MPVNAGVQAQTDGPANRFCNLSLVDGPETGKLAVLYTAKVGHEFGNEGGILCFFHVNSFFQRKKKKITTQGEAYPIVIDRTEPEHVHNVRLGSGWPAPLAHLDRGKVSRGVNVSRPPPARHLPNEGIRRRARAGALNGLGKVRLDDVSALGVGQGRAPVAGLPHDAEESIVGGFGWGGGWVGEARGKCASGCRRCWRGGVERGGGRGGGGGP